MLGIHLECIVNATKEAAEFSLPHWNFKSKELINCLQRKLTRRLPIKFYGNIISIVTSVDNSETPCVALPIVGFRAKKIQIEEGECHRDMNKGNIYIR